MGVRIKGRVSESPLVRITRFTSTGAKSVRRGTGRPERGGGGSEFAWTGPLGTAHTRRHCTLVVRDGAGGDAHRGRCGGSGEAAV